MDLKEIERELKENGEVVPCKLQEWAEKRGDKIFFYYGEEDQSFTYREFNQLTNSIAHHLKSMGVGKGDRISLFLKNSLISTLAMFGIWKAGAIFCPINFNFKGRLLSYQIQDTQAKLFITEREMVPLLNDIKEDVPNLKVVVHNPHPGEHDYYAGAESLLLDPHYEEFLFADFLKGKISNLELELRYSDTANIIYTSGTTGLPKGVVHSYRWINRDCYDKK
jgi:crotonobetaine/carnitine-CoA ligase